MGDTAKHSLSFYFFFTSPSCRRRQGIPHPMRFRSSFQYDLQLQSFFPCYNHHHRLNVGTTKNCLYETPKRGVHTRLCLVIPRLILGTTIPLPHQCRTNTLLSTPRHLAESYALDRDLILLLLATFSLRHRPRRRNRTPASNPKDIFHGRATHSFSSGATSSRRRRSRQAWNRTIAISRVSWDASGRP